MEQNVQVWGSHTAHRLEMNIDVPLPPTFPSILGDPSSFFEKCLSRKFLA